MKVRCQFYDPQNIVHEMATLQAEAVVIYVACFSVGMDNAPA